jgi:hypothetical protein
MMFSVFVWDHWLLHCFVIHSDVLKWGMCMTTAAHSTSGTKKWQETCNTHQRTILRTSKKQEKAHTKCSSF